MYYSPIVLRQVWPKALDWMDNIGVTEVKFFTIWLQIWHVIWLLGCNLVMWGVYHIKHPWFEQYKINNEPWPWEENRE
jgi:hypothetical protein